MIRWTSLANRAAAAEETVHDHPGMEQIIQWGEAALTNF
jgi:hypothetical protein